jgi:hypothetical protein
MAADRGWVGSQWVALDNLWTRESNWDPNAVNPDSGAYGIPQSLGHGHPFDLGDARAQIAWGLDYIAGRPDERDPIGAWKHEQDYGWYERGGLVGPLHVGVMDQGGWLDPGWNLNYNGLGVREPVGAMAGSSAGSAGGGDIVVNVTVQGSMLGDARRLAETLAEPLRTAIKSRNGMTNGNTF